MAEEINKQFRQGTTRTKINLHELNNNDKLKAIYKRLLSPLVKDKQLMEIIIDNRHKLRHRFSYELKLHGKIDNEPIQWMADIKDYGNRTPEDMYESYHTTLNYKPGKFVTGNKITEDATKLGIGTNYKLNEKIYKDKAFLLNYVEMQITFAKG